MIESLQTFEKFLAEHWLVISLVISEVAALLPTKYNGILQGVLKIGGLIFKKKVSKR